MRDKDELDQMIDAALASYGDAPAVDGIEQRVLRGVQRQRMAAEPIRLNRRRLLWPVVLAAAACIAAFLIADLKPMRLQTIDSGQLKQQARSSAPAAIRPPVREIQPKTFTKPVTKPITERRATNVARLQSAGEPAQIVRLPKLDVFPTPHSPSEDEATLAFFFQQAPESEVRGLLGAQARADASMSITELEIPPIEPLNEGGK